MGLSPMRKKKDPPSLFASLRFASLLLSLAGCLLVPLCAGSRTGVEVALAEADAIRGHLEHLDTHTHTQKGERW